MHPSKACRGSISQNVFDGYFISYKVVLGAKIENNVEQTKFVPMKVYEIMFLVPELLKALQKGESDLIIYQTPSAIKDFDSFAEK